MFTHFVSRNALDIEGLSEATLEKFIDEAMIKKPADIFRLQRWKERITSLDGFGEKSFSNIIAATEKARHTTPARLLFAIGIPNIGVANAKMIAKVCRNNWDKITHLTKDELVAVDGIGEVMADAYTDFFDDEGNAAVVRDLMDVLVLDESFEEADVSQQPLAGKTFVITGKVTHFENRDGVKTAIEHAGGKTAGSVSSKTDYLINNDIASSSGKNKKAKELGVPIITEEEFLEMLER